jgi:2-methylcitrate dehydratase PrpD
LTHADIAKVNVTELIVSQVHGIDPTKLPGDVLEAARHSLLDWCGIAIAGATEPLVLKLIEEAREQGGHPLCTVIYHGERTSPAYAALINGSAGDALDFADSNLAMRGHTTPAVVATALAVGEWMDISGLDLLGAIVAGVETGCRVGTLVNFPFLKKGFHPTGNLVPFAATAAAAHLLDLSPQQWAHALGIAATQAAGLLASGGTMSKPFHSGKAATNGVLAANLAKRDWIARANAIEAYDGFIETHASGAHVDRLREAEGRFFILDTLFKAHAACQLTHSTIENMLELKNTQGVTPANVETIEVQVPPTFLTVCNIQEPKTGLESKFSLRAVSAMALLGDDTHDIASYNAERANSPEFIRLRDRVRVVGNDKLSGGVAVANVELNDGRKLTATNDCYKPLRDLKKQREVVSRKFMRLVSPKLGGERADKLLRQVLEADALPSVRQLIPLTLKQG